MGKRQRAQGLAMAPSKLSTGAMKNGWYPSSASPPGAAAETAVANGTEIETETGSRVDRDRTGPDRERDRDRWIETGTGSATEEGPFRSE